MKHLLEVLLYPAPALSACSGGTGKGLKLLKGLNLVILYQLLDLDIGDTLALTDDFCRVCLVGVGSAVLLQVVVDCGPESLVAEYRAVELMLGKPAAGIRDP